MTLFTYTHSIETDVPAEAIWALYEDVTTWPSWDAEAELITRDGPFETGSTGTMKFKGQEPLGYRLAHVDENRCFVDETPVGELTVRVSHELQPTPDGRLKVTYRAEIDGPQDEAQRVGPMITSDFPATMASLIERAKS
jgi:polyketide cyclase/dehydrase/lipid transport protein